MSSSLFDGLTGAKSGSGGLGKDILLRAVGAWMRGESPRDFLKTIANAHPAFRQIDADDLEAEAHRLCKERGMDEGEIGDQIKQFLSKM